MNILTFTLLLCVSGYALVVRDLQTITSVLDDVEANIGKLGQAVKASTDDPAPLLTASNGLIAALTNGTTKVNASGNLTFAEAVALIKPVQKVTNEGQSLVNGLKGIRAKVERLGECDVVRLQASSISNASQGLITAVVSKVPEAIHEISNQLSARLTTVLQQTQDDFSQANCKNFANDTDPGADSQSGAGRVASTCSIAVLALVAAFL